MELDFGSEGVGSDAGASMESFLNRMNGKGYSEYQSLKLLKNFAQDMAAAESYVSAK